MNVKRKKNKIKPKHNKIIRITIKTGIFMRTDVHGIWNMNRQNGELLPIQVDCKQMI